MLLTVTLRKGGVKRKLCRPLHYSQQTITTIKIHDIEWNINFKICSYMRIKS